MNQDFKDGNFQLTEAQMESARLLGQEIIDYAKANNVDLRQFPEVKAAMGYDKNGAQLSAEELGAFMIGYAMQNTSMLSAPSAPTVMTSSLSATNSFKGYDGNIQQATDVAVELGRQVYGDTRPAQAAIDTSSSTGNRKSIDRLADSPNMDRQRC
jgi:hypothetical protein